VAFDPGFEYIFEAQDLLGVYFCFPNEILESGVDVGCLFYELIYLFSDMNQYLRQPQGSRRDLKDFCHKLLRLLGKVEVKDRTGRLTTPLKSADLGISPLFT
jgi:hypothetical protein